MKRKKRILYMFCILCLAGAAFSGWKLYLEIQPRVQAESVYEEIRTSAFPESLVNLERVDNGDQNEDTYSGRGRPDFALLREWNPDVAGWLYGPGTSIDYPVVQGTDNEYYLNHTSDGQRSIIGSVFMESKNRDDFQDDLTVIYGHHIRGGRMFSSLSNYKKQSYYEEHPMLILYTPEGDYRIDLFASEILNGKTAIFTLMFGSEEKREAWINEVIASSAFNSEIYPEEGEKMIALCTCTYEYQDARYAVYGILKPLEEENR